MQNQDISINEEINEYLNKDLLEKLNLIISKSKQFMRISKQKKLTKEIVLDSINTIKFQNSISKDELFPLEEEGIGEDNYININEYLNEPIIEKPLDTMVFYHWFCIDGFSPKTSVNKLDNKKMVINPPPSNPENILNNKLIKDNHDLIIKMTKNISKELVSFAINFEKIFQEAIKDEFIIKNDEINFDIKKDMEMNATIIKTEPEIVQLFPYILAFLEENIKNKEIMKMPKMQYIILYHIKSISVNKYFDLITYMNNILELLMTLLLYSNHISDNNIKDSIKVKNEIISFMIDMMKNNGFDKYIPDLVFSISHFVLPINNSYPNLFKAFSAIKFINSFGYDYIANYIYPQIIQIKSYIVQPIIFKYKNKIIFAEKNKPQNQIQINNNNLINNQSNQNSQSQSSIPLKIFSVPFSNDFAIPMSASNFAGESLMQSFLPNINNINEKIYFRVGDVDEENEKLCKENLISFFYIEIFRSIEIILNGMKEKGVNDEQFEQNKNDLIQIFGESLVNLFFDVNNINLH